MSLIFLAADFPPQVGGIQRYIYEFAAAQGRRGEQLLVVATQHPQAGEFDAANEFPIVRVAAGNKGQVAMAMAAAATEITRGEQLDSPVELIVATKWSPEGPAAKLIQWRTGLPYIVMGYGREMTQTGANLLKWLVQNIVVRGAVGGLAISHYTAGQFQRRGLHSDRIHVIYGGVHPQRFEVSDQAVSQLRNDLGLDEEKVLLTVSRLVQRKGHHNVIRALPQVARAVGPVRYLIAGTGPQEGNLRCLAAEHRVSALIHWLGYVPERQLPALYKLADVFIMPSRDLPGQPIEGFGLVYLEANLAGTPVIGGRTGGTADAIEDEVSGLLVDPENVDDIAAAAIRLLTDKVLATRLARQGYERVLENFTWDKVAQRFQAALCELNLR